MLLDMYINKKTKQGEPHPEIVKLYVAIISPIILLTIVNFDRD